MSAPEAPPSPFIRVVRGLSFLLGVVAFVVANAVLYLMAYPTFPNPGDQSDIRLPLYGLVLLVVVVTFLGRAGFAFGAGFATGFVAELLFLSGCTTHWADPGGTALANVRSDRRMEIAGAEAKVRARLKWIGEMRKRGLDPAVGVHRVRLATGCVLSYRAKHGDDPPAKDSLPDLGERCGDLERLNYDETGWRIRYSRVAGTPGDALSGVQVRAVPDTALRVAGPLIEIDSRGIILQRDSAGAPALAVGSPVHLITRVVMDCIRTNAGLKPASPKEIQTLRHLVFYPGSCTRIQLQQVKTSSGTVVDDPNVARLYLPTTGPYVGIPLADISTSWDLTYVPHAKTATDGYDLHARPMQYGYTGVRSYLFTAGSIHATAEDRRATPADPPADACEVDPGTAC